MGESVGVVGDATPEPSESPDHAEQSTWVGAWAPAAAGPTESSYSKLTVGSAEVIYEASCDFEFIGTDSAANGAAVTGSSSVTVTSGSTILQSGGDKVLLNGDTNSDIHGNALTINATGKLTSS